MCTSIMRKLAGFYLLLLGLIALASRGYAQPPPPRPISVSVNPSQGLRFGAFYQGSSGGTIAVDGLGNRTSTGSITLLTLGYAYGAANFEIVASPGTLVTIINGPTATLTGSSGGSMSMSIGNSSPSSPFVTTAIPPAYNSVNIGGTLTVSSPVANPVGSYSGSFYITFMQQ